MCLSLFLQSSHPEKNVQFQHQYGTILVATVKYVVTTVVKSAFTYGLFGLFSLFLHGEQDQESDHQTEETHSFRQGESQNGIGEQLLLQGRVPGISDDETAEDSSDSSSRSSHSHGGGSGTNELSSSVDVPAHSAGLETTKRYLGQRACRYHGCAGLCFDLWPGKDRSREGSVESPGASTDHCWRGDEFRTGIHLGFRV